MKQLIELNRTSSKFRVFGWTEIKEWLIFAAKKEGFAIQFLSITLLKDKELLSLNYNSLKHDYFTDIITFDLSDQPGIIIGDIYISYDRIKENSSKYSVTISKEIKRVFIHGLLHLTGYKDKTVAEKKLMTEMENEYLSLFDKKFHVKQTEK